MNLSVINKSSATLMCVSLCANLVSSNIIINCFVCFLFLLKTVPNADLKSCPYKRPNTKAICSPSATFVPSSYALKRTNQCEVQQQAGNFVRNAVNRINCVSSIQLSRPSTLQLERTVQKTTAFAKRFDANGNSLVSPQTSRRNPIRYEHQQVSDQEDLMNRNFSTHDLARISRQLLSNVDVRPNRNKSLMFSGSSSPTPLTHQPNTLSPSFISSPKQKGDTANSLRDNTALDTDEDESELSLDEDCKTSVSGVTKSNLNFTDLSSSSSIMSTSVCSTASTASSFCFEPNYPNRHNGTSSATTVSSQDSVSNKDLFLIDDEIADQPDLFMTMAEQKKSQTDSSTTTNNLVLSPTKTITPCTNSPAFSGHTSLTPTNDSANDTLIRSINTELESLILQTSPDSTSLPCEPNQEANSSANNSLKFINRTNLKKRHSYTASSSVSHNMFRQPRPLSFVENADGTLALDSSSLRAVSQDLIGIKTLLFRLQGILQNVCGFN